MGYSTLLLLFLGSALLSAAVSLFLLRFGPIWDDLAEWQMKQLVGRVQQLWLDPSKLQLWLRIWGLLAPGVFFGVWLGLKSLPLACMAFFLAYMSPRWILEFLIRRRARLMQSQLATAALGMGNAVKAGVSLAEGLKTISAQSPQPLCSVLSRVVFEFERGRPLKESLEQVRQRLELEAFTLFSLAIETTIERGGRVNEALDRISTSLQETQRLERQLDAATSSGQQVVFLLAIFPLAFLGGFYCLSPGTTGLLFTTTPGQIVLTIVVGLIYVGVRWAVRMLQIQV